MGTSPSYRVSADLAGRVCVVTGANTGIGRVTALELARAGGRVFLACRSEERAAPVVEEIQREVSGAEVEFLPLDLADLDSVRASAEAFLARGLPLHVLINNAGLAGTAGQTKQGFELAFGVNHLGHFLYTLLLIDALKASAPSRIVHVASVAHYKAKGIDFEAVQQRTTTKTGLSEYQVSKLANVLFSAELARRLEGTGVSSYALHPGVVASDVWRSVFWPLRSILKLFMISNEEGAQTTLYCATEPGIAGDSGYYYDTCVRKTPSAAARDAQLAAELWARSLEWTQAPDLPARA